MAIEIKVPDIGADEVEITEILVKVGDKVEAEQSLITVEGDKASMEVPSPQAGVVKEIKVSVGDKTETGKLIMIFDSAEGAAAAAPAQEEKKEAAPAAAAPALPRQRKKFTSRISAAMKSKSLRSWLKWATPSPLSNP
ncbi:Dihydrolipoamide acetyltransferase component of pyruvate dehydrogenase complex [Klebsiella pneumoniae IS46]|nr:Dihydrolipoamide acetyltransferase component of pyruvate dehydrogenase complex [Klebsiella pneumoniae IS46]